MQWQRSVKKESRGYTTGSSNALALSSSLDYPVFGEASSQIDSVTESLIQESLWALMQNKTTLVIAHRLLTLLHMDRILVFEKGHIVEDGIHDELLQSGGLYKTLRDAQVGGFLADASKD